jgi:hypothetical protein
MWRLKWFFLVDLEILFWLVFLLAPVLSRLLRGKSKKRAPSSPTPASRQKPTAPRELTPFEEALQQIQEALTEGRVAEAPRQPEPLPEPPRRAQPKQPVKTRFEEFRTQEKVSKPRFFDDAFEQAPPFTAPGADEHYHEPLGEVVSDAPAKAHRRPHKNMSKWQEAMKNVVILNEPRSRSRWTPPGK